MEQPATSDASIRSKLCAALVIAFGLFHCAGLLAAIFPRDFKINTALAPYRLVTGTEQEWGMFHTIPTRQSMEIVVEVTDAAGGITAFGPILPGLRQYHIHSSGVRYYYLLNQLTAADGRYFDAFIEKLRREVASTGEGRASEFSLQIETDYVRLLERINEDGVMTLRNSETFGPFAVGTK